MQLHGQQIIGGELSGLGPTRFQARNPATGEDLPEGFCEASPEEVDRVVALAAEAFPVLRGAPVETRAAFLERIAEEIEKLGDVLLERANAETALGLPRLTAERGRACAGARMFAALLREGSWVDARIDTADPGRQPLPKPDLRLMHRPIGPVAVFGASNFPFAISVAGTDTVAALGAGCPVVVKAHPAHPGTCELLGAAIARAAEACELPPGVFSLLQGPSEAVGQRLVEHPQLEAVAFTGSLRGGRALFDAAARRARPIPVYAEMGSLNPVFLLPGALEERAESISEGFLASLTLGTGQFCTNPGLVVGTAGESWQRFRETAVRRVADQSPSTMLHAGIWNAYQEGTRRLGELSGVEVLGRAAEGQAENAEASAMVFGTSWENFLQHEQALSEEVFGPASVLVECAEPEAMRRFAERMDASLSATIHGTEADLEANQDLVALVESKVGRLVFNGYPTGLEVCPSMHHGGAYPAATHSFFTSVGTNAILRFVRPVCYQGFPSHLLPEELRDENPRGLMRMVNGERTRDGM